MPDDGMTIVLSPVQLAAVLEGATLDEKTSNSNRLWGGLQVVGGAIELVGAAALLLTPEPTMVTKVGGGVLGAHGADTISTGLRQLWSGRPETTLTAQAAEAAARSLGVDPETAGTVGMTVDIAVPLVAGFAGALRALSIRAGRISLVAEEAAGGHTIARHVGLSEAQLRARLLQQPRIPAASSFRTLTDAEIGVSQVLRVYARQIALWAKTAQSGARLPLNHNLGRVIGYAALRNGGKLQEVRNITVVLEKTQQGNKVFFVLTAYPKP